MADEFGLLELPVPRPTDKTQPVGDPLLATLGSFLKAVVNADTGAAWSFVCPIEPRPVAHVFTHDPSKMSVSSNTLPALYIWRGTGRDTQRYAQDLLSDDTSLQCLWVPPPATQDAARRRFAFRNAIRKALRAAFGQGRHPAWVVPGDTYFQPDVYGSVLLTQANCSNLSIGQFVDHELVIPNVDGTTNKNSFDCLSFTVNALELFTIDTSGAAFTPQTQMRGTISIGSDPNNLLEMLTYQFDLTLAGVDPSEGSIVGGDLIAISGKQFVDGMTVWFGDVSATNVVLVDDSTLTVITPAHAAGTVDLTVRSPGDDAVLPASFTFS